MAWIDASMVALACAVAAWLRPWRLLPPGGLAWPAIALAALMPLAWHASIVPGAAAGAVLSLAPLLVLICGWPMAVLVMVPVAALAALAGDWPMAEALRRLAWGGMLPATFALAVGAWVRHRLPRHPFVYLLGRAYGGTFLAVFAAATLATAVGAAGPPVAGAPLVGPALFGLAEAFVTGAAATVLCIGRPEWLATYSDRLYLPGEAPR